MHDDKFYPPLKKKFLRCEVRHPPPQNIDAVGLLTDGGVGRRNWAGGTTRADVASLADRDNESNRSSSSTSDCIDDHSCASSLASFLRDRELAFSATHSNRLDDELFRNKAVTL